MFFRFRIFPLNLKLFVGALFGVYTICLLCSIDKHTQEGNEERYIVNRNEMLIIYSENSNLFVF